MTFCFRKISFVHCRSGPYYALLLGYFGLNFLPDIRHCVYWVLTEIWGPNSFHRICNKIFYSSLPGPKGRFVCVWNCFISFLGEYSSVWPEICCVLPQIQSRFLHGIAGRKVLWKIFSEILLKAKAIFYRNSWNFAILSEILFWVRIALKRFAQVISYVFCPQVRRHVHKKSTKRRYGEENQGRFVFGKPVLFTVALGLTTPYSLAILVSNFYQTFITVSIEFWLRFEAQIRPTGFAIIFLFITAKAERKVRLCVKLFYFFPR